MSPRRRKGGKAEAEPKPQEVPERISRPFAEALAGMRARDAKGTSRTSDNPVPSPPRAPRAPAPTRPAGSGRYEDRVALAEAYRGVQPMDRARPEPARPVLAPRHAPSPDDGEDDRRARERLAALVSGGLRFDVRRDDDGRVDGLRVGADPGALKSLGAGSLRAEAEIDLHGLTAEQASASVTSFVRAQQRRGNRLVRIVHGKGLHSGSGAPVLRDAVLRCLCEGAAAPFVLAFASCGPRQGGLGALLVRLSR